MLQAMHAASLSVPTLLMIIVGCEFPTLVGGSSLEQELWQKASHQEELTPSTSSVLALEPEAITYSCSTAAEMRGAASPVLNLR